MWVPSVCASVWRQHFCPMRSEATKSNVEIRTRFASHSFSNLSFFPYIVCSVFFSLLAVIRCCGDKWNTPLSSFCLKFAKSVQETRKENENKTCVKFVLVSNLGCRFLLVDARCSCDTLIPFFVVFFLFSRVHITFSTGVTAAWFVFQVARIQMLGLRCSSYSQGHMFLTLLTCVISNHRKTISIDTFSLLSHHPQ